jgi:DNA invertase Pin-like site-specific DNA recombinase
METAPPSQSCVGYYRVSTQKQGRSGLGLEAQQSAVRDHLNQTNRKLVAEFIEIESGKNPDRPKLAEALKTCRLTRSKLIVARLDRLARNVAFVSRLMESGIDFEAVDFPQANRLMIHILAAVAEYEGRLVSERIKAALAAAKARGVKLGRVNPGGGCPAGLAKGHQVIAERMAARAADLAPVIAEIRAAGSVSLAAIARQLNERGMRPVRGDRWSPDTVRRILSRLLLVRSASEARQAQHRAKQHWIATIAPVISDLRRSGYKTLTSIGHELNARGVPRVQSGRWDGTAVLKALRCLPEDQRQSIHLTREEFASRLRPVIEEIQAAGKTGVYSIACTLNARGIPSFFGGRWGSLTVHNLLTPFDRREKASDIGQLASELGAHRHGSPGSRPFHCGGDGERTQRTRGPCLSRRSLDDTDTAPRSQRNAKAQDRVRTQNGHCACSAARRSEGKGCETVKEDIG